MVHGQASTNKKTSNGHSVLLQSYSIFEKINPSDNYFFFFLVTNNYLKVQRQQFVHVYLIINLLVKNHILNSNIV